MQNEQSTIVTRSKLRRDLKQLGVVPGKILMFHASVRAIGWIVGGPDTVIQALLDVLTPRGTLMMYVSWEEWERHLVAFDEWPQRLRRTYLDECPAFDAATSRAMRNWSILTEYLRTWTGAHRSNHPTASVVAVGAHAEWLTANHPLHYGYGADSPFAKLCEAQGQLLLLGTPLSTISLFHYAEHMANVPDKRIVRNRAPVLLDGERVWTEFEEFDTCIGIKDRNPEEYFDTMAQEYLLYGKGRRGDVGAARSYLFDAADLARFAVAWIERQWGNA